MLYGIHTILLSHVDLHAAYSVCILYLPYLCASSGEFFHGGILLYSYILFCILLDLLDLESVRGGWGGGVS